MKATYGTLIHGQTGQEIEEGAYEVRPLTRRERKAMPARVAALDGEAHPVTDDTAQIMMLDSRSQSYYVRVWI